VPRFEYSFVVKVGAVPKSGAARPLLRYWTGKPAIKGGTFRAYRSLRKYDSFRHIKSKVLLKQGPIFGRYHQYTHRVEAGVVKNTELQMRELRNLATKISFC